MPDPITGGILAGGQILGGVLSNKNSNKATNQAVTAQTNAANQGIAAQKESEALARADLAPYNQFGAGLIPQANALYGVGGDGFSADAGASNLISSPIFQSLLDESQKRILSNQAVRGRLGAGDTAPALQDAALRTGYGLLSGERADVLSALGIGQNSAARTGVNAMQGGVNRSGLYADIGNAQAAGAAAKAANNNQMINGFTNLGGLIFGGMM